VTSRHASRDERENGFTLIELMVVVLIIAILISIAIPTFLGARQRAQDRASQSSLRNALTAAKTAFTDNSDYSKSTNTDLHAIEPSLTFEAADTASTGPKDVSVAIGNVVASPADSQVWAAAVLSKSGKCFWIRDQATGAAAGTFYGSGATCTGTAALAAAGAAW
jgi:type IV pilus assembly protein PilA